MDFSFSEDQRAIADMAHSLFSDSCTDESYIKFDESGATTMESLWSSCIETGLHALFIPESAGGSGLSMTDLMVVLEAQGRALGQVPLWRHQVAAAALVKFGDVSLHSIAAAAAQGETLLTLSHTDLSQPKGVSVKASKVEGGMLLTGTVLSVPEAATASAAIVLVETSDGVQPVVLPLDHAGITRVDGIFTQGESVSDLTLDNVTLPDTHILPLQASSWLECHCIAALGALQLGVSEQQLKRTVEYVTERRQFDRQIGSFQAVQMGMADCQIALEALRSTLWQLCFRLDNDLPAPSEALAVAWHACEAGHIIGHKAQHVHGGFGVDISYPMHRFLYWSRAISLVLGGSKATLERLGDWLATNDKLGWKYDLDENKTI
jgi:alkylation response protein AidB-like acyl-CoA dehydrogenase